MIEEIVDTFIGKTLSCVKSDILEKLKLEEVLNQDRVKLALTKGRRDLERLYPSIDRFGDFTSLKPSAIFIPNSDLIIFDRYYTAISPSFCLERTLSHEIGHRVSFQFTQEINKTRTDIGNSFQIATCCA